MEEHVKKSLLAKNQKLIDMIIERAKRDFPEDIAAVGLIGSFTTNEYHEKSDLDLIIIINNDNGWGIAKCFIFDDVGYDFYCTSWDKISTFTHMEVYYCAKPEYRTKINELLATKQNELNEPVNKKCLEKAKKHIDLAKENYANVMLAENIGSVRYASGEMVNNIIEAISELNNKVIRKYGLRKCLETLLSFEYLPKEFEKNYMMLIEGKNTDEVKQECIKMLKHLVTLYDEMCAKFFEKPTPTYDNLKGTYEELWCNCRNKILRSTSLNDKSYAFLVAVGTQNYFDEMTTCFGTKKIDIMQYFNANNLNLLKEGFIKASDEYLYEYKKVGRMVEKFDSFEDLYSEYMKIIK